MPKKNIEKKEELIIGDEFIKEEKRKEKENIEIQISSLESTLKNYHDSIDALKRDMVETEKNILVKKNGLNNEIKVLEEKKDQLDISISNSKDTFVEEDKKVKIIKEELIVLEKSKKSIEKEIETLNNTSDGLKRRKSDIEKEIADLAKQKEKVDEEYVISVKDLKTAEENYNAALLKTENLIRREEYAKEQEIYLKDQFKKIGLKYVEFKA